MADSKKRGLGRGLSALLPGGAPSFARPASAPGVSATATIRTPEPAAAKANRIYFQAAIEEVFPSPEQPRTRFAEAALVELAASITAQGIIVPLVVRPRADGGYYLIAGERRWRAAQRAGLQQVPVVVQDITEGVALERALVENLQRADLGALEEAVAYQRLVDEYHLKPEQIAERVGKDRSTVANAIRLLKLPPGARQLLEDELLQMGHARALLGIDDAVKLERAARTVVDKGLSVRATEALVKRVKTGHDEGSAKASPPPPSPSPTKSASVRDLEERLTRSLGGPVSIVEDEPGKAGRIEIKYISLDHLDRLLDRLL